MDIIQTNILDISENNIDQTKVNLADKIINKIVPLLDSEFLHSKNLKRDLSESIKKKKIDILANKNILEKISVEFNRKKKQQELVNIISEIVKNVKLSNDFEIKSHIKLVLKTIEDLQEKRMNEQIKKFKVILNENQ